MSNLVERLREWGHPDWFYVDTDLLEENQSVRLEAAAHIEALEAALQQSVDDWRKRGGRIETLEAALREIADALDKATYGPRAALAPEQDK